MESIKFYCRKCKAGKSNLAPIEMGINVNGERVFLSTNMRANPNTFRKDMSKSPIKEYISEVERKVSNYYVEAMQNDIALTAEVLKDFIKRGCVKREMTLGDLFTEYLNLISARVGVDMSRATYTRYEKAIGMFYEALGITPDTPAKDITHQHAMRYKIWLNQRLMKSSSCGPLTRIKSIFKYAFESGKIQSTPFVNLKIEKGIYDKVLYLLPNELEKLVNKDMPNIRLQSVKDAFLFSCYTGLAFCDMKALRKEDFQVDENGVYYIDKRREKTNVRFFTILLPSALQIAQKYNFNFHIISNQKMNAYLKEIAAICGIDKELTFHAARHTACSIFLNQRPSIPIGTIQRIFGWQSESMVRHYASVLNSTITEDVAKAFNLQMIKSAGGYSTKEIDEINPNEALKEKSNEFKGKFKLKVID